MLTVADEKGGQLDKRIMIYADEIGTLPKIEGLEMMFSASRSRKISIVAIIQSLPQTHCFHLLQVILLKKKAMENMHGIPRLTIISKNCKTEI